MSVPARLTFVTIGSRDVQGLAAFYKKLGFEVVVDAEWAESLRDETALLDYLATLVA